MTNDRPDVLDQRIGLVLLVPVLPVLLSGVWSVLATGKIAAALAPVAGPFAGVLLGHWDCTMARCWPGTSLLVGGAGLLALVGLVLPRRTGLPLVGFVLWILFWLGWCALAAFSILNTLE